MDEQKKILEVFRYAIANMGWKQADVMDILGVTQSAASMFMSGKRPVKPIHIKKMAERIKIEPVDLVKQYNEWTSALTFEPSTSLLSNSPIDITTKRHIQTLEKLQQKDIALEITELLLEIETIEPSGLKEARRMLRVLKIDIEQEAAKKRTANGEN